MSMKVTRYEPEEVNHRDRYETATMYEKADGGYVEFDDYEALRRERDAMAIYRDQGWKQAEKLEQERDRLAERCRWLEECLGGEQRARHQAELDGIAMRAEVERLKEHEPRFEDVERLVKTLSFLGVSTPESMETACIRWLSLVRTLIRTAEDSKMLRQDSERQAEAKRIRILLIEAVVELKELKESVGYRAHTIGVIQRIDAALEASQ